MFDLDNFPPRYKPGTLVELTDKGRQAHGFIYSSFIVEAHVNDDSFVPEVPKYRIYDSTRTFIVSENEIYSIWED
jgi:hypothetical protein